MLKFGVNEDCSGPSTTTKESTTTTEESTTEESTTEETSTTVDEVCEGNANGGIGQDMVNATVATCLFFWAFCHS